MLISKSFGKLDYDILLIFLEETGHITKFATFFLSFNVDNEFFIIYRDGVTFFLFFIKDHDQELKDILDTVVNYVGIQVTCVEKWCNFSVFWFVTFVKLIKTISFETKFNKNFFWNFSELDSIVNHIIGTFLALEFSLLFFVLLHFLNVIKSFLEILLDFFQGFGWSL